MKGDYLIVLFKNKKKRKIIKSYLTKSAAINKFNNMLLKNNDVYFEKVIENATSSNYELGLLTNQTKIQQSLFLTDELGRNTPVNLENPEYVFLDIKKYKMEETIFDWQTQNKITFMGLIKKYCKSNELKSIFTLHNKLCIQINEDVSLFSLKDKDESDRLLEVIQDYFIGNSRLDAIFVRDISSAQRKWIYSLLVGKGFDKKRLYRLKTTFSKR
jgi:hypothetical protein